jgi:hypothetical protein
MVGLISVLRCQNVTTLQTLQAVCELVDIIPAHGLPLALLRLEPRDRCALLAIRHAFGVPPEHLAPCVVQTHFVLSLSVLALRGPIE